MTNSTPQRAPLVQWYCEMGWSVIPLTPDTKAPFRKAWEETAIRDPDVAAPQWRGPWAHCNIGIACGPSGLVVIDVDCKDGRDGFRLLAELRLPKTFAVRTPSGGMHLYYRAPKGQRIGSRTDALGPGVDVKAWGGQVVAAGSEIEGRHYEIKDDRDPVPLPKHLIKRMPHPRSGTKTGKPMEGVIPQGERNTRLTQMAGSLRRQGLDEDGVLDALRIFNERCDPPLSDPDLETIARSAGTWEPTPDGSPHTVTPDDPDLLAEIRRQEVHDRARLERADRRNAERAAILGGHDGPLTLDDVRAAAPNPATANLWGQRDVLAWTVGQPLVIAGEPGTGKSTLAQQAILRRAGLIDSPLLGLDVVRSELPTACLFLDRPMQLYQSIIRMVPDDASTDMLKVFDRLPVRLRITDPASWVAWIKEEGCGALLIDSIKDIGLDLNESSGGALWNDISQALVRADIELVALHHTRKVKREDRRPPTIEDVYGSRWITAGAGSVIILHDGKLYHVKSPMAPMTSQKVTIDLSAGTFRTSDAPESAPRSLESDVLATLRELGQATRVGTLARLLDADPALVRQACLSLTRSGDVKATKDGSWRVAD